MIGDSILWFKNAKTNFIKWFKSFKKELFCIHEYSVHWIGFGYYESCKKCGRVK